MATEPENLNTHHLRQFREEMQKGFADLRTDIAAVRQEQASTTTKLEAMAQTLVGVQRDIRSLQASVAMPVQRAFSASPGFRYLPVPRYF